MVGCPLILTLVIYSLEFKGNFKYLQACTLSPILLNPMVLNKLNHSRVWRAGRAEALALVLLQTK